MDFDDQLRRYFGTTDLATLRPEALAAGVERMQVDLGLDLTKATLGVDSQHASPSGFLLHCRLGSCSVTHLKPRAIKRCRKAIVSMERSRK